MFGIAEIKRMNAEECRRRTEQAKRKLPAVKHLIDVVDRAIDRAVEQGLDRITFNPLSDLRCIVSEAEAKAVWDNVRGRGFKVTSRAGRFSIEW